MPIDAEWLQSYYQLRNMRVIGQAFVLDNDGAVRIFCVHENAAVHLVREVDPWESDYVELYELALTRNSTVYLCPQPETRVH